MDIQFDLNLFWFAILGCLLTGYAILDGFDLGVGILHLFTRTDQDRRLVLNSIGPIWDGNAVWLVTFGGALFAAFPHAYATAFSGFYTAFMLLLFALIFRAVSIEFRSKRDEPAWRSFWDVAFCGASTIATFIFGVAVGNAMLGVPIDKNMEFHSSLFALLRPYPVMVGFVAIALFALHGSIYLFLKTEGELQQRIRCWMWRAFFIFLGLYVLLTSVTLATLPQAMKNFERFPWAWVVVGLNILAIANIPRAIHQGRPAYAFISSTCTIAAFNFLFGIALYPNLLVSSLNPEWSLNIYNAASSTKTLGIMRLVAILGIPFVLSYSIAIHWVFRGKVTVGKISY